MGIRDWISEPEVYSTDLKLMRVKQNLKSYTSCLQQRFNVHNGDDLKQAIEDIVKQILLQMKKNQGTSSNLQFKTSHL